MVFATTMVALGILGLSKGDFIVIWQPVPKSFPGRETLVYVCALISLASGVGLVWQRTAAIAARVLLLWFLLWLLIWRLPAFARGFTVDVYWAACQTAVMLSAAWVLYNWFATDLGQAKARFRRRRERSAHRQGALWPRLDPVWSGSFHLLKADGCARARGASMACGMGISYRGYLHRGGHRGNHRGMGATRGGTGDVADGTVPAAGVDT